MAGKKGKPGPKTPLYKCPLADDGLCPFGGMKTKEKFGLWQYCYNVNEWVFFLYSCPTPEVQR